jgi:hypothetical protein
MLVSPTLRAAIAVAFGLVAGSSAQAQAAAEEASLIGERVRVRYCNADGRKSADGKGPCYRTEGQLLALAPDVLRVQPSKGLAREISRAEVERLERFLGTSRSTGRGALTGGGIGLGFGLLFSVLLLAEEENDGAGPFIIGAPLVGGAVGALIGAGIGALPKERWTDVAEDQWTVAVVGGGGRVGLGLRLAF